MTDMNQPKRMKGALLSGVLYLDEQGRVQDVHWCMTADGDDAPADLQPVIRTGTLDTAAETLVGMLAELVDRFAQAAALEAANGVKGGRKAPKPVPATPALAAEEIDEQAGDLPPADEKGRVEEISSSMEEDLTGPSGGGDEAMGDRPAAVPGPDPAPSMPGLFDGLDMS
jgi:hypothetical protein